MSIALTAPEVAVLRSAAVLADLGVPASDRLVVAHTLGARGVQINGENRDRYAKHLANLIRFDLIEVDDPDASLDGTVGVVITAAGRDALKGMSR